MTAHNLKKTSKAFDEAARDIFATALELKLLLENKKVPIAHEAALFIH